MIRFSLIFTFLFVTVAATWAEQSGISCQLDSVDSTNHSICLLCPPDTFFAPLRVRVDLLIPQDQPMPEDNEVRLPAWLSGSDKPFVVRYRIGKGKWSEAKSGKINIIEEKPK